MSEQTVLINLRDYTPAEFFCFCTGGALWVVAYLLIIRDILKRQFVAVPAFSFCGFISWEVLWGYVHRTDMGALFVWGLRVYLPLSICIVWGLFRYGYKQVFNDSSKRHMPRLMVLALVAWMTMLTLGIPVVDDPSGMTSATVLSMLNSIFVIPLLLRLHAHEGIRGVQNMSYTVAWLRLLANGFAGTFSLLHLGHQSWLVAVVLVTWACDAAFLFLYRHLRSNAVSNRAAALAEPSAV